MPFGGVVNGRAYQDLPLGCEVKRHYEIAAQPGNTFPDLAKLYHSSPVCLHEY